jgi:biopolymer transport protein ExbB
MFTLLQAAGADAAAPAADAAAPAADAAATAAPAAADAAAATAAAAAPVLTEAQKAAAAAEAAKAAGQGDMTLMDMIMHAHPVSKVVLVILILCAVVAVALLFEKVIVMRSNKAKTTQFLAAFKKAKTPEEAAGLVAKQPDSIIRKMFNAGWGEVQKTKELGLYSMEGGDHTLDRMNTAMSVEQNKGVEDLGSNMTFLASIGSNAPFIGLFGTVWGIMYSFIGIANSQTTSLAVVAPGIAEALFATAAGLLAAIPAVLIYNFSAKQISTISGYLDDFKAEFLSLVSRDMDRAR